jgi:alkylation response protein AidB-like acyl-CoA dehydrogenase
MQITFTTTEEQQLLRSMARELFEERGTSERVREVMLGDEGLDEPAYGQLAELGLTGLTIPEEFGGGGASHAELAILFEELGRRLLPVPLLSSCVLGTEAVLAAGSDEQCKELFPGVASGTTRLALAHLDAAGRPSADPGVRATRDGGGWELNGTSGYVVDGRTAHVLVTAATTEDGLALFLVPGDAAGVLRDDAEVLDLTRPMATVAYEEVRVGEAARLSGGDAHQALHQAITAGCVMLANEQVGGAEQMLRTTTSYAKERVQFGRAIGSFQAVKHRLAETLVRVEAARSTAYHAARALAEGDAEELAIAAPMAKSYCSEVYEKAAADAIQLHGGIAFTWEHDAHLYLKRAKATKLLLGSPEHQRRLLGDVLGL